MSDEKCNCAGCVRQRRFEQFERWESACAGIRDPAAAIAAAREALRDAVGALRDAREDWGAHRGIDDAEAKVRAALRLLEPEAKP